MQRTDRLFEIIQILRAAKGRPLTAGKMAEQLEVSTRTIYRHITTLQGMRVPIVGEAGIGYVLRAGYDLPPLNFDRAEQEALIIGMGMLARTGDSDLQRAAQRVLAKIETSLTVADGLGVSDWGIAQGNSDLGACLRRALAEEEVIEISYTSLAGETTRREVLPLILTYHVEVAVLSAWCRLRQGFRAFRIDRITAMRPTGEWFTGEGEGLRQALRVAGIG